MNRIKIIRLLICLTPLFLSGCPYESDIPLGSPYDAAIDQSLIGNWRLDTPETEDEAAGILNICAFNDHELVITAEQEDKKGVEILRAFTTRIGGQSFLNVQSIEPGCKQSTWLFVNYGFADGRLTLRIVEEDLFEGKEMTSSADLAAFIKENQSNKKLYDGDADMVLVRLIKPID